MRLDWTAQDRLQCQTGDLVVSGPVRSQYGIASNKRIPGKAARSNSTLCVAAVKLPKTILVLELSGTALAYAQVIACYLLHTFA